MNGDGELIETLEHSALYQGYQNAFTAATGLPLALRPMVTWQLPLHGKPGENSFCSMTAEKSRTCAACLQLQDRLAKAATQSSCTMTCGYGLSETAVPIRLGAQTIGYLQTGQVLLKKPTPARFRQAVKEAQRMGVDLNTPRVREEFLLITWPSRAIRSPSSRPVLNLRSLLGPSASSRTITGTIYRSAKWRPRSTPACSISASSSNAIRGCPSRSTCPVCAPKRPRNCCSISICA